MYISVFAVLTVSPFFQASEEWASKGRKEEWPSQQKVKWFTGTVKEAVFSKKNLMYHACGNDYVFHWEFEFLQCAFDDDDAKCTVCPQEESDPGAGSKKRQNEVLSFDDDTDEDTSWVRTFVNIIISAV